MLSNIDYFPWIGKAAVDPAIFVFARSIMKILSIVLFAATIAAAQISGTKTGPEVGQKVPTFEARDQNGKLQTLATLRGSKGLVLLFVRSADW